LAIVKEWLDGERLKVHHATHSKNALTEPAIPLVRANTKMEATIARGRAWVGASWLNSINGKMFIWFYGFP